MFGTLGCALSHMRILRLGAQLKAACDFYATFEDDVFLALEPPLLQFVVETLVKKANQRIDLVYLGSTGLEAAGEVFSSVCIGGINYDLARTKHAYGAFAFLLRQTCIKVILRHMRVGRACDQGMYRAASQNELIAAHIVREGTIFDVVAHRKDSNSRRRA